MLLLLVMTGADTAQPMPTRCSTGQNDAVVVWALGKLFFGFYQLTKCFIEYKLLVMTDTKPIQPQHTAHTWTPPGKPAMSLLTPSTKGKDNVE